MTSASSGPTFPEVLARATAGPCGSSLMQSGTPIGKRAERQIVVEDVQFWWDVEQAMQDGPAENLAMSDFAAGEGDFDIAALYRAAFCEHLIVRKEEDVAYSVDQA